jgi:DNA replication ATP-dependent helicase Dna2
MPYHNPDLNEEQNRIINKALDAEDYFLLVGPPGTGKTSLILRNLTFELYKNPTNNILLLAYTNRAVDEICEAISELDFLRIGSEYSTAEKHRSKLLDKKIETRKTRKEVKELMDETRIFVATVAAVTNKPEIFTLKNFSVAIIDEASQILEPQIIGILPLVEKFVMIGDHKQLPAIVLQNKFKSQVKDEELHTIGLENRSNSLFERLYNLCKKNAWTWAYDTLSYQGRMHIELADFPNQFFYENVLKPARPAQIADFESKSNFLDSIHSANRLNFIATKSFAEDKSDKIHTHEAMWIAKIVENIIALYKKHQKEFSPEKSLGIITPYRNQIAHIRNHLQVRGIENYEKITVDTVERYQGSQRDIIIISFCINKSYQLKNLVSLTDDGLVDRKLNVALTRAKEQMILLGNIELLQQNEVYANLISYCKDKKILLQID